MFDAFSLLTSNTNARDRETHRVAVERVSRTVTFIACCFVALMAGHVVLGWLMRNEWLIYYPATPAQGTTMALTAIRLLLCVSALWLLRSNQPISPTRRWVATIMAAIPVIIGIMILLEYATDIDLGIDAVLSGRSAMQEMGASPRRPRIAATACLMAVGLSLAFLDAPPRIRRVTQSVLLIATLVALDRFIAFLLGERGSYLPQWQIMGQPVLQPMSPKTATCILALAAGIVFSRPDRGLLRDFLAQGPGGFLARLLIPLSIFLPILFGWLGQTAIRAGVRGADYPLSLVVLTMAIFLVVVVTLCARAIQHVDDQRTRAVAATAERERLLQTVFDNANAGMFLSDPTGELLQASNTLQQMTGYTTEELRRLRMSAVSDPGDVAASRERLDQLLAGERPPYRLQKLYYRKDRTQFWGELSVSVSRDADGSPEFIIGMVDDITDRKNAEETQRRLTMIVDATPDFVGISNAQGKVIYLNRAAQDITGLSDLTDVARSIADFHPPDVAQRILEEALPAAARTGLWTDETEVIGADGRCIPVSQVVLAHKTSTGEIAYYSTIMRDITYRKKLEESQEFLLEANRALAGSLERDDILRSLTNLVVPRHADLCVAYLLAENGQIRQTVITRTDRGKPQLVRRLHPIGKRPNALVEEVLRTRQGTVLTELTDDVLRRLSREHNHPALLGKLHVRSFMAVPLGRDHLFGAICYTTTHNGRRYDTNDLALAQRMAESAALALENAQLLGQSREATRIRDEVLRVVAHDLRNPLNTIGLTADFLESELVPPEDGRNKLKLITRAVAQADHLIQDLLDVARMEVGQLVVEASPMDARTLAKEAIELNQTLALQRGIELQAQIPDQLSCVEADSKRVQQVFSNLIGNAIKFSPRGAQVVLSARKRQGAVCFSVRDNGPGIAPDDFPHLFDPFWQAKRGVHGAGLGLPIARAIVHAHGGTIWAESKVGAGSTFNFTLPIAEQQFDQSEAAD